MLRGNDATGVVAVGKNGDFSIMKDATTSVEFLKTFIDSPLDKGLFSSGKALIGHNRAKTIGANKAENAHPFVYDHSFAMVHNGTLYSHKHLADTEVDSEALTHAFAKAMRAVDWKKAMEDTMGKVSGAYACVWFDQLTNEICMLRNSQRPLSIVETPSSIIFGSEVGLLYWIASRNGEKIEKTTHCAEHTLYSFNLEKAGGEFSEHFLSLTPQSSKGYKNGTTATVCQTTLAKTGITELSDVSKMLSKSSYKNLRSKLFRQTIRFEVADVLDQGSGKAVILGESTNGQWDLCDLRHTIEASINYREMGFDNLYELFDNSLEFEGVVSDTQYVKESASIDIVVEGVKNVSETSVVTH